MINQMQNNDQIKESPQKSNIEIFQKQFKSKTPSSDGLTSSELQKILLSYEQRNKQEQTNNDSIEKVRYSTLNFQIQQQFDCNIKISPLHVKYDENEDYKLANKYRKEKNLNIISQLYDHHCPSEEDVFNSQNMKQQLEQESSINISQLAMFCNNEDQNEQSNKVQVADQSKKFNLQSDFNITDNNKQNAGSKLNLNQSIMHNQNIFTETSSGLQDLSDIDIDQVLAYMEAIHSEENKIDAFKQNEPAIFKSEFYEQLTNQKNNNFSNATDQQFQELQDNLQIQDQIINQSNQQIYNNNLSNFETQRSPSLKKVDKSEIDNDSNFKNNNMPLSQQDDINIMNQQNINHIKQGQEIGQNIINNLNESNNNNSQEKQIDGIQEIFSQQANQKIIIKNAFAIVSPQRIVQGKFTYQQSQSNQLKQQENKLNQLNQHINDNPKIEEFQDKNYQDDILNNTINNQKSIRQDNDQQQNSQEEFMGFINFKTKQQLTSKQNLMKKYEKMFEIDDYEDQSEQQLVNSQNSNSSIKIQQICQKNSKNKDFNDKNQFEKQQNIQFNEKLDQLKQNSQLQINEQLQFKKCNFQNNIFQDFDKNQDSIQGEQEQFQGFINLKNKCPLHIKNDAIIKKYENFFNEDSNEEDNFFNQNHQTKNQLIKDNDDYEQENNTLKETQQNAINQKLVKNIINNSQVNDNKFNSNINDGNFQNNIQFNVGFISLTKNVQLQPKVNNLQKYEKLFDIDEEQDEFIEMDQKKQNNCNIDIISNNLNQEKAKMIKQNKNNQQNDEQISFFNLKTGSKLEINDAKLQQFEKMFNEDQSDDSQEQIKYEVQPTINQINNQLEKDNQQSKLIQKNSNDDQQYMLNQKSTVSKKNNDDIFDNFLNNIKQQKNQQQNTNFIGFVQDKQQQKQQNQQQQQIEQPNQDTNKQTVNKESCNKNGEDFFDSFLNNIKQNISQNIVVKKRDRPAPFKPVKQINSYSNNTSNNPSNPSSTKATPIPFNNNLGIKSSNNLIENPTILKKYQNQDQLKIKQKNKVYQFTQNDHLSDEDETQFKNGNEYNDSKILEEDLEYLSQDDYRSPNKKKHSDSQDDSPSHIDKKMKMDLLNPNNPKKITLHKKFFLPINKASVSKLDDSNNNQSKCSFQQLEDNQNSNSILSTPDYRENSEKKIRQQDEFNSDQKNKKKERIFEKIKLYVPKLMNKFFENPLVQLHFSSNRQIFDTNQIVHYVKLQDLRLKPENYIFNVNDTTKINISNALKYSSICNCTANILSQFTFLSQYIPESQTNEIQKQILDQFTKRLHCICNNQYTINYEHLFNELKKKDELVTLDWVKMHYQQIVWKLASYEMSLQHCPINKLLRPENIYNELEFRLYKENIANFKSIIRKILNGDEFITQYMILLVNRITYDKSLYIIELSDGWYPIFAAIPDNQSNNVLQGKNHDSTPSYYSPNIQLLLHLIKSKKIQPGMKLHVSNLKPYPLASTEKQIQLEYNLNDKKVVEIEFNSISRARYHAKLGQQKSQNFIKSLKSLRPNGGSVSMVDVFIIKKYPLTGGQYKSSKKCRIPYEQDEEESSTFRYLFFKIQVKDALIYYNGCEQSNEPYCEIDLMNVNIEMYNSLKVGERIRIFNLKATGSSLIEPQPRYCLRKMGTYERVLYLESTTFTKILYMKEFIQDQNEIQKLKEFGENLSKSFCFSIENLEVLDDNCKIEKQKDIEKWKLEIDTIFYIVKTSEKGFIGISSNLKAIYVEIHNKDFFRKKVMGNQGKISEDKQGKIAIFYNLVIEQFGKTSAICEDFDTIYLRTTENTILQYNQASNEDYKIFIDELKYFIEKINNNRFDGLKIALLNA